MDTDIRRAANTRVTGVAAALSAAELCEWKRDRLAELRALIHSLRAERDAAPPRTADLRVTS
jgi:hypothetical protein